MGTGYTRNDTGNNIADGNVINASDLDGEFDAIQSAFNGSTGHSHDGTTGEGPQIDTAAIADDAVDATKIADNSVGAAALNVSGDGSTTQFLRSDGDGSFTWAEATMTWSVITSSTTATANRGYFVDTTSGAVTVTLPSSPTIGDTVRVIDLGNAATNNITVARNGENIQGSADDLSVATDNSAFGLVFSNTTNGWRLLEV